MDRRCTVYSLPSYVSLYCLAVSISLHFKLLFFCFSLSGKPCHYRHKTSLVVLPPSTVACLTLWPMRIPRSENRSLTFVFQYTLSQKQDNWRSDHTFCECRSIFKQFFQWKIFKEIVYDLWSSISPQLHAFVDYLRKSKIQNNRHRTFTPTIKIHLFYMKLNKT